MLETGGFKNIWNNPKTDRDPTCSGYKKNYKNLQYELQFLNFLQAASKLQIVEVPQVQNDKWHIFSANCHSWTLLPHPVIILPQLTVLMFHSWF